MIRDRGRIKWTSLMLPEHVKMLREWAKEEQWEERGELDEQWLEELDGIVQFALAGKKKIAIRYFQDCHSRTVTGVIQKMDPVERVLKIIDEHEQPRAIPVHAIEHIELL